MWYMQSIDFLKTDNKDILSILKKIENRFIIEKDNDVSGRIFFDYDGEHRLEIKSKAVIYNAPSLNVTLVPSNLSIYGDSQPVTENNLILGSLISDGNNIGIINNLEEKIVNGKNVKALNINIIYATTPVIWHDYRD